jgi:uncharacterized protein with HEPN domain
MREAIEGIRQTLDGKSYDQFASVWHLQKATERGLEIISEASRAISDELKLSEPEIPWQAIAAIGNILRHEYQRVEPRIVWNIVEEHLARLDGAVGRLIVQLPKEEPGR